MLSKARSANLNVRWRGQVIQARGPGGAIQAPSPDVDVAAAEVWLMGADVKRGLRYSFHTLLSPGLESWCVISAGES